MIAICVSIALVSALAGGVLGFLLALLASKPREYSQPRPADHESLESVRQRYTLDCDVRKRWVRVAYLVQFRDVVPRGLSPDDAESRLLTRHWAAAGPFVESVRITGGDA